MPPDEEVFPVVAYAKGAISGMDALCDIGGTLLAASTPHTGPIA
jgi:hypothetical protein